MFRKISTLVFAAAFAFSAMATTAQARDRSAEVAAAGVVLGLAALMAFTITAKMAKKEAKAKAQSVKGSPAWRAQCQSLVNQCKNGSTNACMKLEGSSGCFHP